MNDEMCCFEIVSMTPDMCEEVYEIAKICLPEYMSLQGLQDIIKYPNNYFYVTRDKLSNKLVGFAGIMMIVDEAELLDIAVLPEFRKQKIASKLLNCVEEKAQKKGAIRMLLEVRQSNTAAKHLYEKNSYKMLAVRKDYYSNPKENADIMEHRFV